MDDRRMGRDADQAGDGQQHGAPADQGHDAPHAEPFLGVPGRTLIAAEISGSHCGSLDRAHDLIEIASRAGADLVKFQLYTPDELVALRGDGPAPAPWTGMRLRDLWERSMTPRDWIVPLASHAADVGLLPYVSVFSKDGIDYLNDRGCRVLKFAAPDRDNAAVLMQYARRKGATVWASTNEPRAVDEADLTLWCPPGYPPAKLHWPQLLKFDGLSCHLPDPMIGPLAVAFGAKIIEVHIRDQRWPYPPDAAVSFTEDSLRTLVNLTAWARKLKEQG